MKIECIKVGILGTNCIFIWDEESRKGIVIDPGSEEDKIMEFIEEKELTISHILITHGHFDHVGGVKYLEDELLLAGQKPIIGMHPKEKEYMESKAREKYHKKFFNIELSLVEDCILDLDFIKLTVILLPGHTNYSVCLYSEANGFVIVGDTLFFHSIGTETYYDGPKNDLSDNIRRKLFTLPKEVVVYPGHGPTTTIEEESLYNPYLTDSDTIDPWL